MREGRGASLLVPSWYFWQVSQLALMLTLSSTGATCESVPR